MTLSEAIDVFVERKRSNGFRFITERSYLVSFYRRVGDLPLNRVTAQHVLDFLDSRRITNATWRANYQLLQRFLDYWSLRGAMPTLLLPPPRPAERQAFVPYIYTKSEIRALLSAARKCQKRSICTIEASMLRVFLLTLYATGALCNEIFNLRCDDLDLRKSRLRIHGTNSARNRSIPIGAELRNELKQFIGLRGRKDKSSPIFLNKAGRLPRREIWNHTFRRLRRIAGILRRDGIKTEPRMHDLRASFAVHRITSWIKGGADLNRMLPALAAYIGNATLSSTEQYLSLTPERFRKELQKLSPQRGKKRWRDDPALMRFLSNL